MAYDRRVMMSPVNLTNVLIMMMMTNVSVCNARKNVLFLMVDDLRTQLGVYGSSSFIHPKMHTPHIDSLASRSLLFKRAYVQQSLCTPSRASILTGRRPDTTHVYDIPMKFREVGGNFTTLPQYFKQNGYTTVGIGKIFDKEDRILSWSVPYVHDEFINFDKKEGSTSWTAVPDHELKTKPLIDRRIADTAKETLRKVSSSGRNFFVAVGFRKPHLPFVFPKSFMDKYYPKHTVRLPSNNHVPVNMPGVASNSWLKALTYHYRDIAELNIDNTINQTLPEKKVLELRRAYYAAVSWIDSLVGEVIKELVDLGLSNNTIISFVSDHGYHLGENGMWLKRTNFELSTRTPMMLSIPGVTDTGIQTDQIVEAVDLFPTLVEAAELEQIPECPEDSSKVELCTEGKSLMPLIWHPGSPLKTAAFSQTKRDTNKMGYTLRTERYRYTEWLSFRYKPVYEANWNDVIARELYDHDLDPEEKFNIVSSIRYKDVRSDLSLMLRLGWRNYMNFKQVRSSIIIKNRSFNVVFTILSVLFVFLFLRKFRGRFR